MAVMLGEAGKDIWVVGSIGDIELEVTGLGEDSRLFPVPSGEAADTLAAAIEEEM